MRTEKTLKNISYALIASVLLAILSIIIRKVFLNYMPFELLGYEGLFGNVFSLIALADLGLETVILYRLLEAFANDKKSDISYIMSVYKKLYFFVGIVVFLIGMLLIPFLKLIIKEDITNWTYVYLIYVIQLLSTLCTYFLAYSRLIYVANQQEYICTKIDTIITCIFSIIKIICLVRFHSFILYILCSLFSNLICNICVYFRAKNDYDYIKYSIRIKSEDIKKLGISKDIKNNIVQKICGTIYGGTDNILISAFLGIRYVGLMSNYLLIGGYVTTFLVKVMKPFQVSIGNFIYSNNDSEESLQHFKMFDLMSFFVACFVSGSYFCLFNSTISVIFGNKYLLSESFVFAFALNQYIMWNHQFLTFYRNSFGKYELDKKYIMIAAVSNIVFSILLAKPFGISGIMLGTVIGHLGFWIGRQRVVYTEYISEKTINYYIRQIFRFGLWMIEMMISYYLCHLLSDTMKNIVIKFMICFIVTTLINIIVFCRSKEMKLIIYYVKSIASLKHDNRRKK